MLTRIHQLVSGAYDSEMKLWDLLAPADSTDGTAVSEAGSKKRKVGARAEEPVRSLVPCSKHLSEKWLTWPQHPLASMTGHTGPVQAVSWPTETSVYSGGMDHTVRHWDMTSGLNTQTLVRTSFLLSSLLSHNHLFFFQ